ncbi:Hypothetical protein A7982_01031 [Minicystis rosea]|nr:Hypothetical protein A7982_01031 [Minicystis rosea]
MATGDADPCNAALATCGKSDEPYRLRWEPLVVLAPPGLSTMLSTIRTPIEVIKVVLSVVAAFLDTLAAILLGFLDVYRALILAAYNILKSIIEDLLNAGAYLYYDAPRLTSLEATLSDMGFPTEPAKIYKAGHDDAPPPVINNDAFERWAFRFGESFDDPGDDKRPVFSDGAAVEAVFIVAALPSFAALKQLIYLMGKLFNLDPFINAVERFNDASPDPDLTRARMQSVAPDWEAARLQDLFPPLRFLLLVPELLKSLLLNVGSLTGLLQDMAQALRDKAEVLRQLVDALQAVIDLLDALQSSGLKALAVSTSEGVEGLKRRFVEAEDRPEGGFVAGICLLAAGPFATSAAPLWSILGQSSSLEKAAALDESAMSAAAAADPATWADTSRSPRDAAEALTSAAQAASAALGRSAEEVATMAQQSPMDLVTVADETGTDEAAAIAAKGRAWVREARKKGPRSLAVGLSAHTAGAVAPEEMEGKVS